MCATLLESIPTDILDRVRAFSVSQISDALGFSLQVETTVQPVDPNFRVCGKAVTVLCEPDDNLAVLYALEASQKGDVLVVSASHGRRAVWGEILSLAAQCRGLVGTIVDGAVRDVLEIKTLGYPVFASSVNACRARKERAGKHNIPVQCGSILVQPGAVVVGDANGIVALPRSALNAVIEKTEELSRRETEIKEQLLHGLSIVDILKLPRSP
jgi:4-hydroxy-4-methyl-2-oxoglutarate aldolase